MGLKSSMIYWQKLLNIRPKVDLHIDLDETPVRIWELAKSVDLVVSIATGLLLDDPIPSVFVAPHENGGFGLVTYSEKANKGGHHRLAAYYLMGRPLPSILAERNPWGESELGEMKLFVPRPEYKHQDDGFYRDPNSMLLSKTRRFLVTEGVEGYCPIDVMRQFYREDPEISDLMNSRFPKGSSPRA